MFQHLTRGVQTFLTVFIQIRVQPVISKVAKSCGRALGAARVFCRGPIMSHMEPNLAFCMGKAAHSCSRKVALASRSEKRLQMPQEVAQDGIIHSLQPS